MPEDAQTVRHIHWREAFGFTHLFRAFRIAIHPSKLVLGLLALLALYCGGRILDGLWRPRSLAVVDVENRSEVYLYERIASRGGNSSDFLDRRWDQRMAIERGYADMLQNLGVAPDRAAAERAAVSADDLGRVKDKIEELRTQRVNDAKGDAERIKAFHLANAEFRDAKMVKGMGLFHAFFDYQTVQIVRVVQGVIRGNWLGGWQNDAPNGVVISIFNFFAVGPVWLMRYHIFYFILFTLLFLTIWAIFGGAIARIAAVHVARDEKLSVRAALSFSISKFLSFVSAPLIPLIIVLVVGLVPFAAGLLASIPGVGVIFNIIMAALFILILAAGFVMTLVLLGTFGGFNLMYPTIAVEGSDSFDAISRSFSYVYARPWRMLFFTLVALVYGALCYLFVRMFIWLMLALTHHFVGAGMWKAAPSLEPLWNTMWPTPTARLSYDIDFLSLRPDQDIAAGLIAFWVYTVIGVLGAFVVSFYFSANTIIYYLMRHEVDATEMDDVYLEQADEEFSEMPPVAATVTVETATVIETPAPADQAAAERSAADAPSSAQPPSETPPPST